MLITLSPLGNLSRYIRQEEKVCVHETALLLVDGTSVACSGAILAARSRVLERELGNGYEIVLDGFQDTIPQLLQCLEVLYGGRISLTHDNIIPFLKFGVLFEIEELVELCCVWLGEKGLYRADLGLLLEPNTDKRLKLLDKLLPRVRQQSAASSVSSQDYEPDSPPLPSKPCHYRDGWSKVPEVQSLKSSVTMEADIVSLVPTRSKMRSESDESWKPSSRHTSSTEHYNYQHDDRDKMPAVSSHHSLNTLDSFEEFPPSKGCQTVSNKKELHAPSNPTKGSPSNPTKGSPLPAAPAPHYMPNLGRWAEFTLTQIERLCSTQCLYPEFVKMEVAVAWLTQSRNTTAGSWQALVDSLLGHVDPLQLSDRYISMVQEHISNSCGVNLPANFDSHIVDTYQDERPGTGSRFTLFQWSALKPEEVDRLLSRNHSSFFGNCTLCKKVSKQEIVLKLADQTPCYNLKTDNYRLTQPRAGRRLIDHYHSNTVFHWFLRIRTSGGQKSVNFVSLITKEYSEIVDMIRGASYFKVLCLQVNK